MQPLIGITGEQKPAAALDGALEILGSLEIDVFYADYAHAVLRAGGLPVWIPIGSPIAVLDRLDGLLLAGGDDIDPATYGQVPGPELGPIDAQRDTYERQLFDQALRLDLPTLGICRGPQLMNVHLGGSLHQHIPAHKGWEGPLDGTWHQVAFDAGSALHAAYGPTTEVNSLHHQGLDQLGEGVIPVGHTVGGPDDGLVEAIEIAGKPAVGVQWHPELLGGADPAFVWLVESAISSSS